MINRREVLRLAAAGLTASRGRAGSTESLFDGKTLDGWIPVENSATTLSLSDIKDRVEFSAKANTDSDPVSAFLHSRLGATKDPAASVKAINEILAGPSIYDRERFAGVKLRLETAALEKSSPRGQALARLNKMLIEDAYPDQLRRSVTSGWTLKDGAMASTGSGRGVIYTARDFTRFRLTFTMRHVSGNPDHQACVLIFCTRPQAGEKALDALAGIQMQPPNGGHWDYRPGMNSNGGAEFTLVQRPGFDAHAWSRVEIFADASKGTARMAVAQPVGSKALEVLQFRDAAAGKPGPIAWQMHNAGLFDEFKDVTVELDPTDTQAI